MKLFAAKVRLFALVLAIVGFYPLASHAQTGVCKDGTTTNAQNKRGACAGHGGVKSWDGPEASATPAPSSTATPAPASGNSGGPGQVWVDLPAKIYYCSGDRSYGKTKSGQYVSEADAVKMGARPGHGKSCSAQ